MESTRFALDLGSRYLHPMKSSTSSSETRPGGARPNTAQYALLVGEARGFLTWAPILDREGLQVKAVRTGVAARTELAEGSFHAVIVLDPLPDLPTGAFVEEMVNSRPAKLRGILIVSGEDEDPPTLPLGEGLRLHCCQTGDSLGVEEALVDILDLETRVALRLEIQLEVAIGSGSAALPGLTHNISEGGLLIQTGAPLLPGIRSHVRIELPGSLQAPVEAEVEVVRQKRKSGDGSSSIAVRFIDLSGEHAYRWKRFVEGQG